MTGEAKRKIQVGDKFDIPVKVVRILDGGVKDFQIKVHGTNLTGWICGATLDASRLVEEAKEPLKVGDQVRVTKSYVISPSVPVLPLHIIAIHRHAAWIADTEDRTWVVGLEYLEGV